MEECYDNVADALYIQLADGEVARTEEIDSCILVDVASNGKILGIEVIRPARIWRTGFGGIKCVIESKTREQLAYEKWAELVNVSDTSCMSWNNLPQSARDGWQEIVRASDNYPNLGA
jgi:uncharacterized protein YuzE